MTVRQKRAIWYAVRERQLKRQREYIEKHNLQKEFEQSKYKTMTWFLISKGVRIF